MKITKIIADKIILKLESENNSDKEILEQKIIEFKDLANSQKENTTYSNNQSTY